MSDVQPGQRLVAWGERLTLGFGMAAGMWGLGFVTRLPGVELPGVLVFAILHVCLLLGGRLATTPLRAGQAGMIAAAINLLMLGAILRKMDGTYNAYALLWVPGTFLLSGGLAYFGRLTRGGATAAVVGNPWPFRFGLVAVSTTLLLIGVGGSVTGYEAGLAVPDWPNSYGYNMFLFPLAKMTGGIYYEHAHRLLGALVGLTTLTLMIYVAGFAERRTWVRVLMLVAFVLVCVQGTLGALRVTGTFTWSMNAEDLAPSITYAMFHGTLAQIFFSLLIFLTCAVSPAWRNAAERTGSISVHGLLACALVLGQIIFGVILRHTSGTVTWALHLHITLAFLVAFTVGWYGLKSWGTAREPLAQLGGVLVWTLAGQMLLGFIALAAIMIDDQKNGAHTLQVLVTTLHQTTGAILLGGSVAVTAWRYRLGADADAPQASTEPLTT